MIYVHTTVGGVSGMDPGQWWLDNWTGITWVVLQSMTLPSQGQVRRETLFFLIKETHNIPFTSYGVF